MKKLTKSFFTAIDLSSQLANLLRILNGMIGIPAIITGIALALVGIASGICTWYFDIQATVENANPLIERLVGSVPPIHPMLISMIVLSLTLAPTIVEMFFPGVSSGNPVIGFAIWAAVMFDMMTDSPRVIATLELFGLQGFGWFVGYLSLLFFASLGFELVFVLSSVGAVFLLLKGQQHGK